MANVRLLFLITLPLIVYVFTLAPTITWRSDGIDSGDLATAVAVGGVAHPPGYPAYLVVGEVFKRLPIGDVAYQLNLLSATSAALTVALVSLIIYRTLVITHSYQVAQSEETRPSQRLIWPCAAAASLMLAFSSPFWSQAVITEVYALNALFAALLLYGACHVQSSNERWLVPALFGLLGLSLGNHFSILLVLPILIWTLKTRWQWRLSITALLLFGVGLSIYAIIPIRAATFPPINWGLAVTWPNFLWLVSAEPYRQFLFSLPWQYVSIRIIAEMRLLAEAFMWWGLPVGLLGFQYLFQKNRALASGSLLTFLLFSIYSIGYNTTDSYVYLLPALLIFSLWMGWGLYKLGHAFCLILTPKWRQARLIEWGFVCLPLLSLLLNFSDQNMSQDYEAYAFAHQSLHGVEQGAVIITADDPHTFALWYGRYGLAWRPDVAIVNSNLLPYVWYRQNLQHTHVNLHLVDQTGRPATTIPDFIKQNHPFYPIYLAFLQPPTLEGYRLVPSEHLQRVVKSAK